VSEFKKLTVSTVSYFIFETLLRNSRILQWLQQGWRPVRPLMDLPLQWLQQWGLLFHLSIPSVHQWLKWWWLCMYTTRQQWWGDLDPDTSVKLCWWESCGKDSLPLLWRAWAAYVSNYIQQLSKLRGSHIYVWTYVHC